MDFGCKEAEVEMHITIEGEVAFPFAIWKRVDPHAIHTVDEYNKPIRINVDAIQLSEGWGLFVGPPPRVDTMAMKVEQLMAIAGAQRAMASAMEPLFRAGEASPAIRGDILRALRLLEAVISDLDKLRNIKPAAAEAVLKNVKKTVLEKIRPIVKSLYQTSGAEEIKTECRSVFEALTASLPHMVKLKSLV